MSISVASILLTFLIVVSIAAQVPSEFSAVDQKKLVKFVNVFRANVATRQPPAANLQEVFWEEKLAAMARQDVGKCRMVPPHDQSIGGVSIQLQHYNSVEDLIKCMRQDLVTRPYLLKATFTRMGCAITTSCHGKGYRVLCYWYPLCGPLHNAYAEGPTACADFNSHRSKNFKPLCVRCLADGHNICQHRTRSQPDPQAARKTAASKKATKQPGKAPDKKPSSVMNVRLW